ncbi:MAG: sigma-54-dependent Fis family transcriptional regulator [Planctomycetes bacterium]|nr:sigma-54-dependent Fis family transcriptional regulator [Planctomycetota bacterium]
MPPVLHTLVVDDDEPSANALASYLQAQGLRTSVAGSLASAREQLAAEPVDLVMLDLQLPDGNGTDLLRELERQAVDVVMISGQTTIEDAIAALRLGAVDFLQKPLDLPRLQAILANQQQRRALRSEVRELRRQLIGLGRFGDMIGASPAMQRVYECIERVAPTNETVLIMGPSGAGKEVTAATIQRLSRRKDQPFVTVNCGAIAPSLIESELFGHERGAFTGAEKRRKGLFEQADRGTLFLDEVTEMPIELQVRLLRVLETGRVTRVGGTEEVEVDVRLLAATNRDPEQAVADGKLRHDLLYRLLVFPIELPALCERPDDVELLAAHFLDELNDEYDDVRTLSAAALGRLQAHGWPGNVRELYNTLRRAYVMAKDEIQPSDLLLRGGDEAAEAAVAAGAGSPVEAPAEESEPVASADAAAGEALRMRPGMPIAEAEQMLIEATLRHTGGNKKEAANLLGISVKTLYSRLQVYEAKKG